METLQMLAYAAYIGASGLLGARLLLQWRRTRQAPELSLGLGFLLAGGAGYAGWAALAILEARSGPSPVTWHAVATVALALTCLGAFALSVGVGVIFRPNAFWPRALAAGLGLSMIAGWTLYALGDNPGRDALSFWVAFGTTGLVYLWTSVEAAVLFGVLRRRAVLGLASPLIASRALLWAVACALSGVMVGTSILQHFVLAANVLSAPFAIFQSAFGLLGAVSIWLGFFPPEVWRRCVLRAAGAEGVR